VKRISVLLVVFSVLFVSAAQAGDGRIRKAHKPVPEMYIVMLNDDITDEVGYVIDELMKGRTRS
jgi:hypothetical protein